MKTRPATGGEFSPYDPADALASEADIALFLADAAEAQNADYMANARAVVERARARNQARDREALAVAIGSLRLEGIEPDTEALANMERVISGEVTIEDVIKNITARVKKTA